MKTQGEIPFPYQVQPDRVINDREDGTMESTVEFITTVQWQWFLPVLGDYHPDDSRLELNTRELSYSTHGLVRMTGSYMGLREDPTDPILTYVGSPDREVIETHPDFATLAGTAEAPLNGAIWVNKHTGLLATKNKDSKFQEFSTNASTNEPTNLTGVQYYLKPSTQVELTWWQTDVPTVERMKIVDDIKPFKAPDDVVNFLIVDTPYRQVGNFYQVSQIALGSGAGGWNEDLYPQ